MSSKLAVQEALIYAMVTTSAIDHIISERESRKIRALVTLLPVFDGFDPARIGEVAQACGKMLEEGGVAHVLEVIATSIPERLHQTAYALSVDVAAVDADIDKDEIVFLDMLRRKLGLDKLTIAAIERAACIRYMA